MGATPGKIIVPKMQRNERGTSVGIRKCVVVQKVGKRVGSCDGGDTWQNHCPKDAPIEARDSFVIMSHPSKTPRRSRCEHRFYRTTVSNADFWTNRRGV